MSRGCGWASMPASRSWRATGTSASRSRGPPGSARRATEGRCCSRRRPGRCWRTTIERRSSRSAPTGSRTSPRRSRSTRSSSTAARRSFRRSGLKEARPGAGGSWSLLPRSPSPGRRGRCVIARLRADRRTDVEVGPTSVARHRSRVGQGGGRDRARLHVEPDRRRRGVRVGRRSKGRHDRRGSTRARARERAVRDLRRWRRRPLRARRRGRLRLGGGARRLEAESCSSSARMSLDAPAHDSVRRAGRRPRSSSELRGAGLRRRAVWAIDTRPTACGGSIPSKRGSWRGTRRALARRGRRRSLGRRVVQRHEDRRRSPATQARTRADRLAGVHRDGFDRIRRERRLVRGQLRPERSSSSIRRRWPRRAAFPSGRAPSGMSVDEGAVWVANSGDGTVSRVDPRGVARRDDDPTRLGQPPGGIVAALRRRLDEPGETALLSFTSSRLPRTIACWKEGTMRHRVWLSLVGLAVGAGLLAAAGLAGACTQKGGTLRIGSVHDVDSLDPAIAYGTDSWALEYATCAELYSYPDKPGSAGCGPDPRGGGRLPRGSRRTGRRRRSSSSGRTASTPARASRPRTSSPPSTATPNPKLSRQPPHRRTCTRSSARTPSSTGRRRRSRHQGARPLHAPDPDDAARARPPAAPRSAVLLSDRSRTLPPVEIDNPLGSGPYYIASHVPNRQIVLERNRFYRGPRPANVDRIVWTFQVARGVPAGGRPQRDGLCWFVPPEDVPQIVARYGINRPNGQVLPSTQALLIVLLRLQPRPAGVQGHRARSRSSRRSTWSSTAMRSPPQRAT